MSGPTDDRRAELIAAAIAGELTADEKGELSELRLHDPSIDEEISELSAVAGRVSGLDEWAVTPPTEDLRDRIAQRIAEESAGTRPAETPSSVTALHQPGGRGTRPRRGSARRFGGAALAGLSAAALVVGVIVGVLIPRTVEVELLTVGPPGTLGAVEDVSFTGEPAGVEVDGELIAHTWGTETVLLVQGLPVGAEYTVVTVGRDGRRVPSGTFLGSSVPVDCRMNAALLREDVASVSILDSDGREVATATVPIMDS